MPEIRDAEGISPREEAEAATGPTPFFDPREAGAASSSFDPGSATRPDAIGEATVTARAAGSFTAPGANETAWLVTDEDGAARIVIVSVRGAARDVVAARVKELLALVHLSAHAEHHVDELSGGQQQRVALARALAHTPRVLLMDEPLGALDLKLREQLQDEILRIQKTLGITTILVTHDQQEAMALADRIVLMDDGSVRQTGTADDIYCRPASPFVAGFIGKRNVIAAEIAVHGGSLLARTADGTPLGVPLPAGASQGQRMALNLRPEQLELSREPGTVDPARTSISAQIAGRRFLGNVVHYVLALPWGDTLLSESRDGAHAVGDTVHVSFAHADVVTFPDEDERPR